MLGRPTYAGVLVEFKKILGKLKQIEETSASESIDLEAQLIRVQKERANASVAIENLKEMFPGLE